MCSTCRGKLRRRRGQMAKNYALEPHEVEAAVRAHLPVVPADRAGSDFLRRSMRPRPPPSICSARRSAMRQRAVRRQGYASASVAELAATCGVSKALMYHYYRDKEHLLADIARPTSTACSRSSSGSMALRLPPAAHLRRLIEAFMSEYEHSAARHRVLVQDVKYLQRSAVRGSWPSSGKVVQRIRLRSSRSWRRRQREAEMIQAADDDPVRHDQLDLHLAERNRGPLTYDDMAPVVADLFLGGVGRVRRAGARRAPGAKRRRRACCDIDFESDGMSEAFLCAGLRTPIGRYGGGLACGASRRPGGDAFEGAGRTQSESRLGSA
jgi:AcrR family transcriptional regulator